MSALLQSPNLFRSLRRVSEQEAITTIGRLALTATDAAGGIESLASVALRLNSLHGVEVTLYASHGQAETLEWHDSKAPAPRGSATGMIAANSREWGRLRILFEPRIKSVECPLRFARVLAQHAALMLNRLEVAARNAAIAAAVNRLQHRLDTRKAVSRAAGILANTQRLTHEQALLLLLEQARESRLPLLPLARTVILGQETGHITSAARA
jgi:ANTAR domain-containing protein